MTAFDLLNVLNVLGRWLHVAGAAVAVGVVAAMTVKGITAEAAAGLKRLFNIGAGIALVTGFYNYLVVAIPAVRGQAISGAYHPVIGLKILLAAAFFGAGLVAFRRAVNSPGITAHGAHVMTLMLGLAILMLGAFLRRLWAA